MASCSSDKTVRVWDLRIPKTHTKLTTKGWVFNARIYEPSKTLGIWL